MKEERTLRDNILKFFIVLIVAVLIFLFSGTTASAANYNDFQEINLVVDPMLEQPFIAKQFERQIELFFIKGQKETLVQEMAELMTLIDEKEITKVPLLNQLDYNDAYGQYGTIASHGCGITSIAMIASYMRDELISPSELAEEFGNYNTENGSCWTLFENSAEELGIGFQEQTGDWSKAKEALENGQLVICSQGPGLFTSAGHFIVLTGITEDEKITVNDPNGNNYGKTWLLKDGFKNGFDEEQITSAAKAYFIYEKKEEMQEKKELKKLIIRMEGLITRETALQN